MVMGMPVMWEVVFMIDMVTVAGEGGMVRGVGGAMFFGGMGGRGRGVVG